MSWGPKKQQGLTLVELMLSVIILGIMLAVIWPMVSNALMFTEAAGRKEVAVNNQKLSQALLRYASTTTKGTLPKPPAGWGVARGDSIDPVLEAEIQAAGFTTLDTGPANTTGTGLNHVKRYRLVEGETIDMPLYFTTGKMVTLTYDVGVIYQSTCIHGQPCASGGGAGVVVTGATGSTPEFNASNLTTWDVGGEDYAPVMFNTLELQKDRLRITLGRINRLSDRISSYYYARARASQAAGTNHFPGAGAAGGGNENCHEPWLRLNQSTSDVLPSLGLDRNEFGQTAWGGALEYCANYGEPEPLEGGPYYAALRFNKNLSAAGDPVVGSNVVITF